MKMALAMIVKGTADEAEHLDTCLGYVAEHVDGIYLTFNMPKGKTIAPECYAVAKKYKAHTSEFEWVDDFSAARNFNYSQVTKEYDYIFWLDADDALRQGEVMREVVEKNPADCYSMWYLYDFDAHKRPYIVHQKVRIVKNDGSFRWVGPLHENLMTSRNAAPYLIKGSDVLHLFAAENLTEKGERNLRIALKSRDDNPNEPRSWLNSGNAYAGNKRYYEALHEFEEFLKRSQSDEEKYIAFLRRGEAKWNMGDKYGAIDELRYAIGMKPTYPDGYTKMGMMLVNMKRYKEAVVYLGQALIFPPPEFSIVYFNPRDYDFEPIHLLAIAHYELNEFDDSLKYFELCARIYPKDNAIKEVVDKIREQVENNVKMKELADELSKLDDAKLKKRMLALKPEERSHPHLTHLFNTRFIKAETSGKDVAIFCGFTSHEWSPDIAAKKGVGGSEEAVIHLANRWAKLGWNVTVYNSCGYQEQTYEVSLPQGEHPEVKRIGTQGLVGAVTYKPFWMWNYRDKQDVLILWRLPTMAQYELNAKKVIVDVHDVISDDEFTADRLARIDYVCVKTEAHADVFTKIPREKIRVIPNGIEPEQFNHPVDKEAKLIINTSSPDRSLSAALDIFEKVKERDPEAKMEWAYGWDVFDAVHSGNKAYMDWKEKMQARMKELGVTEHGRLNTREVTKLYERGHVFLYPTAFYEIFCISAVKAQFAGAYPIVSDFAALNEVVEWGVKIHTNVDRKNWAQPYQFDFAVPDNKDVYVERVMQTLAKKPIVLASVQESLINKYAWDKVADAWQNLFNT